MIDEGERVVVVPVDIPDCRGDEPCRERVSLTLLKPPLLLFLGYMQEKLEDDRAVIIQLAFEIVDLACPSR